MQEKELLRKIIEYEEKKLEELRKDPYLKDAPPAWEWSDIPVPTHKLKQFIEKGVVKKISKRWYVLTNREKLKKEIEQMETVEKLTEVTPIKSTEIPQDLFSPIIGYDDIKELFKRSLSSPAPSHILLCGAPASAKTLFLLEVGRLPNAFYCLGGSTTKVGLIDQLFEFQPRYLLIDEIDKMNKLDYASLLSLMETGIVKETKHEKSREIKLTTNVYAACNSIKGIPPEILSRFHFKLNLPIYSREEFVKVATNVLVMRENKPEDLAKFIAQEVSKFSCDVREAIGIARLSNSVTDAIFLLELKRKYKKENS